MSISYYPYLAHDLPSGVASQPPACSAILSGVRNQEQGQKKNKAKAYKIKVV